MRCWIISGVFELVSLNAFSTFSLDDSAPTFKSNSSILLLRFSDPGEDDPDPAVAEREGGLHPEGLPQQEPGRPAGLPQGDWIHGDHVAPLLQDHRVGTGE